MSCAATSETERPTGQKPAGATTATPACESPPRAGLLGYLARLSAGRYMLWCYFVWYLVVLVRYFDPDPRIWLTSLGLAGIIGAALLVNTTVSGRTRLRLEPWPTFRLFLTPFCVSSFAALVKDRGFVLIFSPDWREMAVAAGICAFLGAAALLARRICSVRGSPAPAATEPPGPSPAR